MSVRLPQGVVAGAFAEMRAPSCNTAQAACLTVLQGFDLAEYNLQSEMLMMGS